MLNLCTNTAFARYPITRSLSCSRVNVWQRTNNFLQIHPNLESTLVPTCSFPNQLHKAQPRKKHSNPFYKRYTQGSTQESSNLYLRILPRISDFHASAGRISNPNPVKLRLSSKNTLFGGSVFLGFRNLENWS